MNNEDTIEILNDLLTKAYDAEQGYEHAAERAESSPTLVEFFQRQSALRLAIGKSLKTLISKYGGEPDKGASIAAKAHQVWITMRDMVAGSDDEAILEECERGEKEALEEYNEAIAKVGLPVDVKETLRDHRSKIAEALTTVQVKEAIEDAKD